MSPKEIKKYLPENSGGIVGIKKLREIGYPDLSVVTNSLLNHLDKPNFPSTQTEEEIAWILRESGDHLKDKVKESLLAKRSPQRKYVLLKEILPFWSVPQLNELSDTIYGFIEGFDFYGLDVYAIKKITGQARKDNRTGTLKRKRH